MKGRARRIIFFMILEIKNCKEITNDEREEPDCQSNHERGVYEIGDCHYLFLLASKI
mgnify:FL=1